MLFCNHGYSNDRCVIMKYHDREDEMAEMKGTIYPINSFTI